MMMPKQKYWLYGILIFILLIGVSLVSAQNISEEENITATEPIPIEKVCPLIPVSMWCPDCDIEKYGNRCLCPIKTDEDGCSDWNCDACGPILESKPIPERKIICCKTWSVVPNPTYSYTRKAENECPLLQDGLPPVGEGYEIVSNEYCEEEPRPPEPKPVPEVPPTEVVRICAAKIKITFDKQLYYVGEEFKIVMETFDAQGNHLPHYPFSIQIFDYDEVIWHSIGDDKTDVDGYRIHKKTMKEGEGLKIGKNKIKVYTKEYGDCNPVEDIITIEIKRKEESKPVPCGMGSCIPEPEPIKEEPIEIPKERVLYSCMGCEKESKCYPMGYRKEGKYCSDSYEFVNQRTAGECDNNFECESNVCIGGECLSEGFIEKLIEWIKKIIGVEPRPSIEKACSKLLLEHNIGDYKYAESLPPGGNEHLLIPMHSEDGKNIGTVKCCASTYKDKENIEHGALFCPFESKEDATNSIRWIMAKDRNMILKEYEGEKVFASREGREVIGWINNAYLIVVGAGPTQMNIPLPEDIANAYLKKYPSEFELTEDDIPNAPPEQPWVYCTEEDEKAGERCQASGGALQTDPHPDKDKNCEVYVGCALHREACEGITNIEDKENCYVKIAVKTGDISMCEKIISDASKKEKCLDLTSTQEPVIAEKEFLAEIKNLGLGEATLINFERLPNGTIPKREQRISGREWESLGVIFETPSEDYLQLVGPVYPFNPLDKLSLSPGLGPFVSGSDTHDDLNIIFTEPVKAAGLYLLDLGETDERESIAFLDENGNILYKISPWPKSTFGNPAPGTFVFLIHDGISKIEILENTRDSDDIAYDNLYFAK